ncbi:MAG TPA: adenosyl-hopene transferase HpnH [Candidatus Binatia bacterium]|nr:adenosyl-hopene transferase HpnH [Candidatus Binatia bacterium]
MRFPIHIATDMMKWQFKNWMRGNQRYPFVLMLEPLHTCNLSCLGCSPERWNGDLKDRLTLEQCLEAVDEAGAPVVSICGGEPTVYPELVPLVERIIERKKHIYLCTNGILLDRFFKKGRPHKRLSINVHLDGMEKTHDYITDKPGTFAKAIDMIKEGKRLGYTVCTNTTVFRETAIEEVEEMCAFLSGLGVDGMLISPGYHYAAIQEDRFLHREETHTKFKRVLELSKKYRLYSTPLFLQFAAGEREYPCTPWGNPTRSPKGWKGPCYLIEGKYYGSWKDFWGGVDWDYWESRQDPKCQNCFMHSGFEPSVVRSLAQNPADVVTMARWNFS